MPDLIEPKRLPFEQAQRYWAGKFPVSYEEYTEMADDAKSLAFSAAGYGTAQDLAIVYEAAEKALAEGLIFEKFRKDIAEVVSNTGWSKARQELIYRNNIQTAYSVGRYDRQQQAKEFLPYLMYDAVDDRRTRDTHRAMDNRVYHIDDPVWNSWTPPNGHRCFPGDTPVLTELGWRDISGISVGDKVIGGSGNPKLVKAVHRKNFNGGMIRVKIKGISDFLATPNHRILTLRGWVRAEFIKSGDILVQTRGVTMQNSLVRDVDNTKALVSYPVMPVPGKRESSRSNALDPKIKARNENVYPFWTIFSMDDMVMNSVKRKRFGDPIYKRGFNSGGIVDRSDMGLRGYRYIFPPGDGHFFPNFWPSGGGASFKLFSSSSRSLINIFCSAKSRVLSFLDKFVGEVSHKFSCVLSSVFSVNPLGFYGFASPSGANADMVKYPFECPVVDIKPLADFPVRKLLIDIESPYGDFDGAPLDSFDSLDSFRVWAGSHCILREVEFIETIPYNDNVHNLTVVEDKTYIVKGATVHNCRCSTRSVSRLEAERDGLEIKEGPTDGEKVEVERNGKKVKVDLKPDEGWAVNPAKTAWEPDLSTLPQPLAKEYLKRLDAWESE